MVLFEDGIKLGDDKVEKLVSSYSSFEGDIYDKFKGKNTVSGIKFCKRQGTESECWVVNMDQDRGVYLGGHHS